MLGRAHPSIAEIEAATCIEFNVRLNDMRSDRRWQEVARARQVAMFLARERTPYSLPQIGRCFNRDHTTVIHAVRRIEAMSAADSVFAARVRDCGARI